VYSLSIDSAATHRHSSIIEDNNLANDARWRIAWSSSPATLQQRTRASRLQQLAIWSSVILLYVSCRLALRNGNDLFLLYALSWRYSIMVISSEYLCPYCFFSLPQKAHSDRQQNSKIYRYYLYVVKLWIGSVQLWQMKLRIQLLSRILRCVQFFTFYLLSRELHMNCVRQD